MRQRT